MTLKTLEKGIRELKPEEQRKFLRDLPALIRLRKEDMARLKVAETSFAFWNNPQDSIYDSL
jgi:acyl-CoA reductase-like NAD-dependent aldehyde dehydrogenase